MEDAILIRAAVIALAVSACMRPAAYLCADDHDCVHEGEQGVCEPTQRCSFRDATCESGRRYAELSGEHANRCVGEELEVDAGIDAQIDASMDAPEIDPDAAPDANTGCPSGYEALAGITGHRYRRLAAAGWSNQRTLCGNEPANVFLAIPEDDVELAALIAFAGTQWVGISDAALEGTFVTVLGAPATFLPWAAGEPDNAGNQDCVRAAGTKLETAGCGGTLPAVCECAP